MLKHASLLLGAFTDILLPLFSKKKRNGICLDTSPTLKMYECHCIGY